MKYSVKSIITTSLIAMAAAFAPAESMADVITIEPLFEYPVAPEELKSLPEKSDYLVQHFWDKMDFKSNGAVDQNALNDAFKIYTVPFQWAQKELVLKSVDNLLEQTAKKPTLQIQFMKAAEEALYGPRAEIWIDEIYVKFLENFIKNKKMSAIRKKRYQEQLKQIRNSTVGNIAPSFTFSTPTGNPGKFEPIGVLTVIEFGDPDCDDCRHSKLKMETDVTFSSLVDKGLINVLFIVPDPVEGWQTKLTGYPSNWVIGASDDVSDIYDLRLSPSFYVMGKDGKIMAKNINVKEAMAIAVDAANK